MRLPRVRFTVQRLMIAVAVVSFVRLSAREANHESDLAENDANVEAA